MFGVSREHKKEFLISQGAERIRELTRRKA